jgi:translocation and assembly module TamA
MRLLVAVIVLTGCLSARRRGDGDLVRKIKFEGNKDAFASDQNDWVLRQQLAQPVSPFGITTWPLKNLGVHGETYAPRLLKNDWQAIETYYAHNGWFDAEVLYWTVEEKRRETRKKAGIVDVTAYVEPGPATRWAEGNPHLDWPDREEGAPSLASFHALTGIHPGLRFQLSEVDGTARAIASDLQDRGYAWASVTPRVEARPADGSADAWFAIAGGRPATFGEVRVHGLVDVPEDIVRKQIAIDPGAVYRRSIVDDTEQDLFRMGAFASVRVEPDLSSPSDPVVPIDVTVVEGKFHQLDLGVRAASDGGGFDPSFRVAYANRNVRQKLIRLELAANLGAAVAIDDPVRQALFGVEANLFHPRMLGPDGDWTYRAYVQTDLLESVLPRLMIGTSYDVGRDLGRHFRVTTGPHVDFTAITAGDDAFQQALLGATMGLDWVSPYAITSWQTAFTADHVRDEADARRGTWAELRWRWALPGVSVTAFHDVGLDLRGFLTPRGEGGDWPLGFAARVQTRYVLGGDVPYPERLFLGGSTSLRGFRNGAVGAYDCLCVPRYEATEVASEWDVRRRYLPHGGAAEALATGEVEWRHLALKNASAVGFIDAGALGPEPADLFAGARLRWDVGMGVRYATPVGPLRVDVATRPIVREDVGPILGESTDPFRGIYVGCDQVGPRRRAYDLFSEFNRKGDFQRSFPAVNLFVSIGEAF